MTVSPTSTPPTPVRVPRDGQRDCGPRRWRPVFRRPPRCGRKGRPAAALVHGRSRFAGADDGHPLFETNSTAPRTVSAGVQAGPWLTLGDGAVVMRDVAARAEDHPGARHLRSCREKNSATRSGNADPPP